ncbi:MAG: hypothetical protein KDK34_00305 [Leptospiraceae bacterium]|nr:hypothetical protein [Leptospiraceae bacterium]
MPPFMRAYRITHRQRHTGRRFRFTEIALIVFILLVGHAPLAAQNLSVGSVIGSAEPTAPQSTGEIVRASQIGLSALAGQAAFYERVTNDVESSLLYPQATYGQRFWFYEDLIWEVGVYANKITDTEQIFLGTNGDVLIDRQHTEENDYKLALGLNFDAEHIMRVGWNWNTVDSPSTSWFAGSNQFAPPWYFQAYGEGSINQNMDGPYAGLELNFPIDAERKFYVYGELYGFTADGHLNFSSFALGPSTIRFFEGSSNVFALSVLFQAGGKYFFYEDWGIKLGLFWQKSYVRVRSTDGFIFSNYLFFPLSQGKQNFNGFNNGLYIGLTGRY